MSLLHYLSHLFSKPFPKIKISNTSTHEIQRIIHSLHSKSSCGYDEISTKILKISTPFITLHYITKLHLQ